MKLVFCHSVYVLSADFPIQPFFPLLLCSLTFQISFGLLNFPLNTPIFQVTDFIYFRVQQFLSISQKASHHCPKTQKKLGNEIRIQSLLILFWTISADRACDEYLNYFVWPCLKWKKEPNHFILEVARIQSAVLSTHSINYPYHIICIQNCRCVDHT